MRGLVRTARLDQRLVERIARVCKRAQLADRLGFRDRLPARGDRLAPTGLAGCGRRRDLSGSALARRSPLSLRRISSHRNASAQATARRRSDAPLSPADLRVAVAQPRLSDRVVGQQPPRLGQSLGRRRRLADVPQRLAQLLPGLGQRLDDRPSTPIRPPCLDRAPIQPRRVRVREPLGGPLGGRHRVPMRPARNRRQARSGATGSPALRRARPTGVVLQPQTDRHVQLAPQLERQARVRHFLDRRAA